MLRTFSFGDTFESIISHEMCATVTNHYRQPYSVSIVAIITAMPQPIQMMHARKHCHNFRSHFPSQTKKNRKPCSIIFLFGSLKLQFIIIIGENRPRFPNGVIGKRCLRLRSAHMCCVHITLAKLNKNIYGELSMGRRRERLFIPTGSVMHTSTTTIIK